MHNCSKSCSAGFKKVAVQLVSRSCNATFRNPALQNYKAKHKNCSAAKKAKNCNSVPAQGGWGLQQGGFCTCCSAVSPCNLQMLQCKTLGREPARPLRISIATSWQGSTVRHHVLNHIFLTHMPIPILRTLQDTPPEGEDGGTNSAFTSPAQKAAALCEPRNCPAQPSSSHVTCKCGRAAMAARPNHRQTAPVELF